MNYDIYGYAANQWDGSFGKTDKKQYNPLLLSYKKPFEFPGTMVKLNMVDDGDVVYYGTNMMLTTVNDIYRSRILFLTVNGILRTYPHLLELLEKNPKLGCNQLIDYNLLSDATEFYISSQNLILFKDRIANVHYAENINGYDLVRQGGVSAGTILTNVTNYIRTTRNFTHRGSMVSWLRARTDLLKPGLDIYWKDIPHTVHYLTSNSNLSLSISTTHHGFIHSFLMVGYFSEYKQWMDGGSEIEVDGDKIYVDHHSVYTVVDHRQYMLTHPRYRNQLPFGIHPNDYYREAMYKLAVKAKAKYSRVKYPAEFNDYLDLTNSEHVQLINGTMLQSEGVRMQHCIGGEDYLDMIENASCLFFHLAIPGTTHGGTLQLEECNSTRSTYHDLGVWKFNDTWYEIEQFYGYDDCELDDPVSMGTLHDFMKQHFTSISNGRDWPGQTTAESKDEPEEEGDSVELIDLGDRRPTFSFVESYNRVLAPEDQNIADSVAEMGLNGTVGKFEVLKTPRGDHFEYQISRVDCRKAEVQDLTNVYKGLPDRGYIGLMDAWTEALIEREKLLKDPSKLLLPTSKITLLANGSPLSEHYANPICKGTRVYVVGNPGCRWKLDICKNYIDEHLTLNVSTGDVLLLNFDGAVRITPSKISSISRTQLSLCLQKAS